jgi:hypothetical protein
MCLGKIVHSYIFFYFEKEFAIFSRCIKKLSNNESLAVAASVEFILPIGSAKLFMKKTLKDLSYPQSKTILEHIIFNLNKIIDVPARFRARTG